MKDIKLGMQVDVMLLDEKVIQGKDSLLFFKSLTTKAFEDVSLDTREHLQSIDYTCKLLNYYIRPNKFSVPYFIDLLYKLVPGLDNKKFADDIYFTAGIFPEQLEKRLTNKGFYLNRSKRIYRSLSTEEDDAFDQLSNNLSFYVRALNVMKERYLDGRYAKYIINSKRTLN